MKIARLRVLLLATILAAICTPVWAATSPSPSPNASGRPKAVFIQMPGVPLHTEYVVEVNNKGQVVKVKSSKSSKSPTFNVQTYGNALQMWIRKPDGTATVGLFKVTYDYDPKTHKIDREIALVSAGGDWGNQEGAANKMMDTAKQEAEDAQKRAHPQGSSLPSLHEITGSPAPSASPH